jgi:sugar phosphate isomerase/epimerase
MKIGANTMIWAGDFTQEHLPLIDKVAAIGFDVIEILVTSAEPRFDAKQVRKRRRDAGLQCMTCRAAIRRSATEVFRF